MASKHKITVGEELRYDADLAGLRNPGGTYARKTKSDVREFGAAVDAVRIIGASITTGTNTLTVTGASFTSADRGKSMYVSYAGGGGTTLATTIASVTSSTTVTLAATASATVTGTSATWGTDDTAAFRAAMLSTTAASTGLSFPSGAMLISGSIPVSTGPSSGWSIEGNSATIYQAADNTPILVFTKENTREFTIRGLNFAWATHQEVTSTASIALYFDSDTNINYGFYNFEVAACSFDNGWRGINQNEASSNKNAVWGANLHDLRFHSLMTGAAIRLVQTGTGQPNITLRNIYINGFSVLETPIYLQQVNGLAIDGLEFNLCSNIVEAEIRFCSAVEIRSIRSESGTFSLDNAGLWKFQNNRGLRISGIQVQSKDFTSPTYGYVINLLGGNNATVIGNAAISSVTKTAGLAFVRADSAVESVQWEGQFYDGSGIVTKFYPSTPVIRDRGVFGTVATKTSNYSITNTDDMVIGNGSGLTFTLPDAGTLTAGRQFIVKNVHATSLSVARAGSNTIDGGTSDAVTQYSSRRYVTDGANWFKLGQAGGDFAGDATFANAYPGIKSLGNRTVFLGDSITIGNEIAATYQRNASWPNYAAILSKQQVFYVKNAGVIGNTSAQMLARFDTDVAPYSPSVVTLLAGRNDIGGSISLATFQANVQAIVAKVRAIGAMPVLCTITPTSSTAGVTTTQWNHWIRLYSASIGVPLLDFYNVLVDPATGTYLSAYDSGDHIHPNVAGYFAMGQHAATVLGARLPAFYPPVPMDGADTANLIGTNCCLTSATLNGNGEPSGFFMQNPTSSTNSVITGDTTIKGNWLRMTVSSAASSPVLYKIGYAVTVGHTYIFTARVKTSLSAGNFTADVNFSGAASGTRYAIFQDVNPLDGTLYWVGPAPTGATSLQFHFTLAAGSTGYAQMAQVGLYDATALGIDTLLPV